MRRSTWILVVAPLAASCAHDEIAPKAQDVVAAKTEHAAAPKWDETIPRPKDADFVPTPSPSDALAAVLHDPHAAVAWVEATPFLVGQQYPVEDVRDTKRGYHDSDGAMHEDPVEGTTNPAKIRLNADRVERARSLAARNARLASETLRRFREIVADPLKLPDVATSPLRAVALWTDVGRAPKPEPDMIEIRPVERPASVGDIDVVWRFGSDAIQREDEIHGPENRVQKKADQDFCGALSRALLERSAAALRGGDAKDAWAHAPQWLVEGFTDFLGAVEVDESETDLLVGPKWFHERIRLDDVLEARNQHDIVEKWTLAELMKPLDDVSIRRSGERLAPGYWSSMTSLFRCRAWALCHFLCNYDEAKYRSKLLDFLRESLAGATGSDQFAEIMGRPDVSDWGDVEKEFEWYWTRLVARKVGQNRSTKKWEHPATDAPTGRVEDDADFCDWWAETHKTAAKK